MDAERFISGLDLSEAYFKEVIEPALTRSQPDLRYSAALIGPGSEVIGFDTAMSTDHAWGPRIQLFLADSESKSIHRAVQSLVARETPDAFRGYRTVPSPALPRGITEPAVSVWTIRTYFAMMGLAVDEQLQPVDWLVFPEQILLSVTAGRVFRDDVGLQAHRTRLKYYPRDVWLYQLASAWNRIGQEEHLTGRAGFAGDELGSAIIAARLVRDLMRLCFLMERQYAPYAKWFGSAFAKLACANELGPILRAVLAARTWQEREEHLCQGYEIVAEMHNGLGITEPITARVMPFFNRPFRVIHLGGGYAAKTAARIEDPALRRLAECSLLGGVDLVSDNTDCLSRASLRRKLRGLYE
ncbi:MAG: DUF4037 domain-containing protein [Fimbriimonadaceae bacterium]